MVHQNIVLRLVGMVLKNLSGDPSVKELEAHLDSEYRKVSLLS